MAEPDRREAFLAAYENAATITSGVSAEQLSHSTPCDKYDVARLLDHLVEASRRAAALGRGQTPPAGDSAPHVDLSDAPAQLRRAAGEASRSWADDERLSSTLSMPWGEVFTGTFLVDMYLVELATHAWDLARATDQLERLNPALALPALEAAMTSIKPEYRDMVEPGAPFGADLPSPPGADNWERLAAFMGRDPRASIK
jgi:uncharacterized protein (TIGR03086 family)